MITIKIENDEALDMLVNRLKDRWTDDLTTVELFTKMYESYIDGGVFDGGDFDVAEIVDNDYVNWCTVISEGDDKFEDLLQAYKDNDGIGDISCDHEHNCGFGYIEAVDNEENPKAFLMRS